MITDFFNSLPFNSGLDSCTAVPFINSCRFGKHSGLPENRILQFAGMAGIKTHSHCCPNFALPAIS
jgi:hypothetical protein